VWTRLPKAHDNLKPRPISRTISHDNPRVFGLAAWQNGQEGMRARKNEVWILPSLGQKCRTKN